jgi:hypothetical protein
VKKYNFSQCGKCKGYPSEHTIVGMKGTRQSPTDARPHAFVLSGKG